MNSGSQTPDMHNNWHDLVHSPACENLALALQHKSLCWCERQCLPVVLGKCITRRESWPMETTELN